MRPTRCGHGRQGRSLIHPPVAAEARTLDDNDHAEHCSPEPGVSTARCFWLDRFPLGEKPGSPAAGTTCAPARPRLCSTDPSSRRRLARCTTWPGPARYRGGSVMI